MKGEPCEGGCGDERGRVSGWILGVQKLTESHSVVLWFEGAFVKLELPEGTGQGEKEGEEGGEGVTHLFSHSVTITGM